MFALIPRALVVLTILLLPATASAQRPAAQGVATQPKPSQGLRVVARVNDDAITDFDLSQRVMFAIRTSGLQDSPDLRQRMAPQMLRQMIDERLQVQDAKKLGVKPSDSEVAGRYAEIERAAGLGQGQFKQYLRECRHLSRYCNAADRGTDRLGQDHPSQGSFKGRCLGS